MIGSRRARSLERLASTCEREGIPGAIVDCGTFNGGSATIMSTGAPTREVWGFDSFEGLPPAGERDPEHAADWEGTLKASEAKVREAFERFASPTASTWSRAGSRTRSRRRRAGSIGGHAPRRR